MKRVDDISKKHSRMSLISCNKHCSNLYEAPKWTQFQDHVFLDRIDIQIEITPVPFKDISKSAPGEPSAEIRKRVIAARKIQEERYKDIKGVYSNSQMTERMIHQYAEPDHEGTEMLRIAMERMALSARAYSRILKVARTIADLDNSDTVRSKHLAEAISYRNLDRGDWAER